MLFEKETIGIWGNLEEEKSFRIQEFFPCMDSIPCNNTCIECEWEGERRRERERRERKEREKGKTHKS